MSARHSGCCISTGQAAATSFRPKGGAQLSELTERNLGRNASFSGLKSILFNAEGESRVLRATNRRMQRTYFWARRDSPLSYHTSIIKRANLRRRRKDRHQIQSQTTPKGGGTLKKGRGRGKVISMQFCPDGGGGGRQSIIPPQTVHF